MIVDDAVTGLKFKPDDVEELRGVLMTARSLEPAVLDRMVAAAGDVLVRRFSPAQGLKRYREMFA